MQANSLAFLKSRLARRLGKYVILSSTLITLVTASIQIYSEYSREISEVHAALAQIEKTHLSNITARVWVLDTDELKTTLTNIFDLPDIKYISVYENDVLLTSLGTDSIVNVISKTFPLIHTTNNQEKIIGSLTVKATLDNIYQHTINQAIIITTSNAVKTFFVAGIILLIFYQLVGKHLIDIAEYSEQLNIDNLNTPFNSIKKPPAPDKYDELDILIRSFSTMRENLQSSKLTLANNEAKFRGVLETSADGVMLINDQGYIELVNKSLMKMTGYSESELINQKVEILVPNRFNQHSDLRDDFNKNPSKRQMGANNNLFTRRKDGSEFAVEISLTPVKTGNSRIVAAMIQDITLRKEEESKKESLVQLLKQKNNELERFTYTASHDLKSPLVTISGFIGLLKKDIADNNEARVKSDLERISEATTTMQQLLDDLLALSRIGRVSVQRVDIQLNKLINTVLEMIAVSISETHAKITVEPNLPVITAEEPRFIEVFLNLIENAIKYKQADKDPEIKIGTRYSDDNTKQFVFYVQDNGIGIDPRYFKKVFGLFERLSNDKNGSGVGLAIVKRIVDVHGGAIWIEAVEVGKGSRVCFTLPDESVKAS